jgi:hypothetical protein
MTMKRAGLGDLMRWRRWAIAIFCVFAAYRLLTFTPLPLDAPGTLRPVLWDVYLWFSFLHARAEQAMLSWRILLVAALAGVYALALANAVAPSIGGKMPAWFRRAAASRAVFFTAAASALFLGRYRAFLDPELNPDEGQFIAAAHALFADPIYFRSVDVGTSGPVNIFPLMLPAVFGFSPDYASARLVSVTLAFVNVILLYRSLAMLTRHESLARLAAAAALGWFAVLENGEFVHYSSEQVPICLTAIAIYLCARLCVDPRHPSRLAAGLGLVAGLGFFAKMQVVPILAAVGALALLRVWLAGPTTAGAFVPRLMTSLAGFAGGLLLLPVIVWASCVATGTWDETVFSYLRANLSYQASLRGMEMNEFGGWLLTVGDARLIFLWFVTAAAGFAYERLRPWRSGELLTMVELALVCTLAFYGVSTLSQVPWIGTVNEELARRRIHLLLALASPALLIPIGMLARGSTEAGRWFTAACYAAMPAALYAIYAAHRFYPHYQALAFLPMFATVGAMAIHRGRAFAAVVLGVGFFWQAQLLWGRSPNEFASLAVTVRPPEGDPIRALGTPASPITVWGWTVRPYLGSGRPPATRDTNMANFFRNIPEVDTFYRERFLRDLTRARPEVFVDAIGPESLIFHDRAQFGFETIPPIAEYVKANYVLVREIGGERIYARRDVAERAGVRP